MICYKIHDKLDVLFKNKNPIEFSSKLKEAFVSENWNVLLTGNQEFNLAIKHVSTCEDCLDDILCYLEIKNKINYHDYPCLHIAYYSTIEDTKCIDNDNGFYSIILNKKEYYSIGIGACPWCGIPFPSSHHDKNLSQAIGLKKWQKNELKKQLNIFNKSINTE